MYTHGAMSMVLTEVTTFTWQACTCRYMYIATYQGFNTRAGVPNIARSHPITCSPTSIAARHEAT